jgi:hypothetical protein
LASLQCYSFTERELSKLERNIEIHNSIFLELYQTTGATITPKMHSLLHFPNQIRQFGAPRYCWCFRYESKNAPFKKVMRRICNFFNVPWTMCSHHQKLVGLNAKMEGESNYFDIQNCVLGKSSTIFAVKHTRWLGILCDNTSLLRHSLIRTVQKIKISGRVCKVGTFFLLKLPHFETPAQFFRIADIIVSDDGIFLIMEGVSCHTFFDSNSFSFICKPNSVLKSNSLPFPAPLHSFFINENHHVIPNYYHML